MNKPRIVEAASLGNGTYEVLDTGDGPLIVQVTAADAQGVSRTLQEPKNWYPARTIAIKLVQTIRNSSQT